MLPLFTLKSLWFYRMQFPSTSYLNILQKNEVIDRYNALCYAELQKNAQVCIYS